MTAKEFKNLCQQSGACVEQTINNMSASEIIKLRADLKQKLTNQNKWNLVSFEVTFLSPFVVLTIDKVGIKESITIFGGLLLFWLLAIVWGCVLNYKKSVYERSLSMLNDFEELKKRRNDESIAKQRIAYLQQCCQHIDERVAKVERLERSSKKDLEKMDSGNGVINIIKCTYNKFKKK